MSTENDNHQPRKQQFWQDSKCCTFLSSTCRELKSGPDLVFPFIPFLRTVAPDRCKTDQGYSNNNTNCWVILGNKDNNKDDHQLIPSLYFQHSGQEFLYLSLQASFQLKCLLQIDISQTRIPTTESSKRTTSTIS